MRWIQHDCKTDNESDVYLWVGATGIVTGARYLGYVETTYKLFVLVLIVGTNSQEYMHGYICKL